MLYAAGVFFRNAALRALYDRAIGKAERLIPALAAFLEGAPLDETFNSNFESEEKI